MTTITERETIHETRLVSHIHQTACHLQAQGDLENANATQTDADARGIASSEEKTTRKAAGAEQSMTWDVDNNLEFLRILRGLYAMQKSDKKGLHFGIYLTGEKLQFFSILTNETSNAESDEEQKRWNFTYSVKLKLNGPKHFGVEACFLMDASVLKQAQSSFGEHDTITIGCDADTMTISSKRYRYTLKSQTDQRPEVGAENAHFVNRCYARDFSRKISRMILAVTKSKGILYRKSNKPRVIFRVEKDGRGRMFAQSEYMQLSTCSEYTALGEFSYGIGGFTDFIVPSAYVDMLTKILDAVAVKDSVIHIILCHKRVIFLCGGLFFAIREPRWAHRAYTPNAKYFKPLGMVHANELIAQMRMTGCLFRTEREFGRAERMDLVFQKNGEIRLHAKSTEKELISGGIIPVWEANGRVTDAEVFGNARIQVDARDFECAVKGLEFENLSMELYHERRSQVIRITDGISTDDYAIVEWRGEGFVQDVERATL